MREVAKAEIDAALRTIRVYVEVFKDDEEFKVFLSNSWNEAEGFITKLKESL